MGPSAKPSRKAGAADRDGPQGANRSNNRSYCEDLQRRRPPEPADACGAMGFAEGPKVFPERLSHGYQSFLQGRFARESSRYRELGEHGQNPEILVIGCCDSRVSPEVIFDAGPGELFVVRNVANLVPPYEPDASSYHGTSAALEFAVSALKVKHIVVLGHACCGGIRSFHDQCEPLGAGDFIGKWMSQITTMAATLPLSGCDRATRLKRLELAVIEHSLSNLLSFPCVRQRVEAGELSLHGAYFGVATGLLFVRNPNTGEFEACLERSTMAEFAD